MRSSDITRADPDSFDDLDHGPGSSASLLFSLLNGLSPHRQAEDDKFEYRISLVEVLHCLLDAAEQRNAEDRPSGHARLTRVGLTG
ncbi:hypothetical protein D3C85_497990 [compost metagenome]